MTRNLDVNWTGTPKLHTTLIPAPNDFVLFPQVLAQ